MLIFLRLYTMSYRLQCILISTGCHWRDRKNDREVFVSQTSKTRRARTLFLRLRALLRSPLLHQWVKTCTLLNGQKFARCACLGARLCSPFTFQMFHRSMLFRFRKCDINYISIYTGMLWPISNTKDGNTYYKKCMLPPMWGVSTCCGDNSRKSKCCHKNTYL